MREWLADAKSAKDEVPLLNCASERDSAAFQHSASGRHSEKRKKSGTQRTGAPLLTATRGRNIRMVAGSEIEISHHSTEHQRCIHDPQ
jgi:hypothetical protein